MRTKISIQIDADPNSDTLPASWRHGDADALDFINYAPISNVMKRLLIKIYRFTHILLVRLFSSLFSRRLDINKLCSVLIVAPHPDDEVFGCSYLIKQLVENGAKIDVVFLSKGEASLGIDSQTTTDELIAARRSLSEKALNVLGLDKERIHFLNFPDGRFKEVSNDALLECKDLIGSIKPQYVFYPHPYDGSPDHAVATCKISQIIDGSPCQQYYYCVWLWYHMPIYKTLLLDYRNSFLLNGDVAAKHNAMDVYVNAQNECGEKYSGDLPCFLLKAVKWRRELYFKK